MKLKSFAPALLIALGSFCWLASAARATSAGPPTRNMAEEDIKHLTVMIDAILREAPSRGAGIIFGLDKDSLYIVTANHVVRSAKDEAQEIQLQFKSMPGTRVKAMLLPQHDSELDMAVLRVGLNELKINLEALPFDRLGSPGALQRGDEVYMLGYPGGRKWWVNTSPELFAEIEDDWIRFESRLIAGGNSGGALLDGNRDLVGMMRSEEPPVGEAVSITKVISKLREWRYPVSLGELDSSPISFSTVSVGDFRVCGISTSGTTYCWGRIGTQSFYENNLKKDSTIFSVRPVRVRGGLIFKTISVGFDHTCGVTTDGAGYCWGNNALGKLGDGSKENSLDPSLVSGGLTFQSISAGWWNTCGVTVDNKIYCWGADNQTNEPLVMQGSAGLRSVITTSNLTYGVSAAGAASHLDSTLPPNPIKDIIFDSASGECATATSGAGYCWDSSTHKFLKVPATEGVFFRSISGQYDYWCGIEKSGIVSCAHRPLFKKEFQFRKVPAPVGRAFRSVSVGNTLVCGITIDAALYCWGRLSNYEINGEGKNYGTAPVLITRK